jgi:hypothetical protein
MRPDQAGCVETNFNIDNVKLYTDLKSRYVQCHPRCTMLSGECLNETRKDSPVKNFSKFPINILRPAVVLVLSFAITSCGGGGGSSNNNPPPVTPLGIQTRGDAERIGMSLLGAFNNIVYLEAYSLGGVLAEVMVGSDTPSFGTTSSCFYSGQFTLDLNDLNGDGQISSGESTDLTLDNCYSFNSSPVNGAVHEDLITFDADFPPNSIVPSLIRSWHVQYTYDNFTRVDATRGGNYFIDGSLLLEYDLRTAGSAGTDSKLTTNKLTINTPEGDITTDDLAFTLATYDASDSEDIDITGSFLDPSVGLVTVSTGLLGVSNLSTTPVTSGTITVTNGVSILDVTFNSDGSIDFGLDSQGDGSIDSWSLAL